jgi:hypothetical protein
MVGPIIYFLCLSLSKFYFPFILTNGEDLNPQVSIFTINNYEKWETSTRGCDRGYSNTRYDKSQTQCYNCQKFAHCASKYKFFRNKVEGETNYVEEKDEKFEIMLLARRSNKGN